MKRHNSFPGGKVRASFLPALTALLIQLGVSSGLAATYYWDNNGTTAGFGTAGGTWGVPTANQWSTDGTGVAAPAASITTGAGDVVNFGNGATGLGAGTITVSGSVTNGNMTFASGSGVIALVGDTNVLAASETIIVNNSADTISTVLVGAGTTLTVGGNGTLALTGANRFAGQVVIGNNAGSALTLQVNDIENVGMASSLGQPTTAAKGLIQIGVTSRSSTLEFTGASAAASTDRQVQVGSSASGSGGAIILNNNANPAYSLTFANPVFNSAATTSNNRQLQLGGSNTGNNEIKGVIGNNSGAFVSLIKNDSGTWILSGTNTYTGPTTINAGTLKLSGAGALGTTPTITIGSGATIDVSTLNTALTLGGSQFLNASANGVNATGNITVGSGKNVTLGQGLTFTAYAGGGTAPLTVSGTGGLLVLNGAPVTVTTTTALAAGSYQLIAASGSATVSGTPGALTVNGSGVMGNAVLQTNSAGGLDLVVLLAAPTGLTAVAGSGNIVNLSWQSAVGATNYTVKRATVSGGPYTTIGSSAVTNYTDQPAVSGATYYYVVSALSPGGESANSTEAAATPNDPGPSFTTNPIVGAGARQSSPYSGTLAGTAVDADNDPLTFAKVAGPGWLNVAADGTLSGKPGSGDVGVNFFTVSASDGKAPAVTATLQITCAATPPTPNYYLHKAIPANPNPGPSDPSWWWDDPAAGNQMPAGASFSGKFFSLNGYGLCTINTSTGSDSFDGTLIKVNEPINDYVKTFHLAGLFVSAGSTNVDTGYVMHQNNAVLSIGDLDLNGLFVLRANSSERNLNLSLPILTGSGQLQFGRDADESNQVWTVSIGSTDFSGTLYLEYGCLIFNQAATLYNAHLMMNAATGATSVNLANPVILGGLTCGSTSLGAGTYSSADLNTIFGATNLFTGTASLCIESPVYAIRVETAPDGSGMVVPAQTLNTGQSITVYAVARDANGVFIANVPAGWDAVNVTGFLARHDFTPAVDGRSAVFKGGGFGTGQIVAKGDATTLMPSGIITVVSVPNFSVTRPFIWTTAAERQGILDKIATNTWAQTSAAGIINGVADSLSAYEAGRDAFLRQIPVNWSATPPVFPSTGSVSAALINKLNQAQDCSLIYYLTGDPRYARLAADVLHNCVRSLYNDINSAGSGGWAYGSTDGGLFMEAREVGYQLPIVYDFLQGYLQTNQVWDVATTNLSTFSTNIAQAVFQKYWTIVGQFNAGVGNWSSLMRNCYLHNALGVDDAQTRSNDLNYVVDISSTASGGGVGEASLASDASHFDQAAPYAVWPESTQYAGAVRSGDTYHMSVIQHYDPARTVYSRFALILESVQRLSHFNYPSGTERIAYGDGYHDTDGGISWSSAEYIYHFAKLLGQTNLIAAQGGVIVQGLASGAYDRSTLTGAALLWAEPVVTAAPVVQPVFRTDTLPYAGIALQRNLAPNGDPIYGLMSFVGGGEYEHNHPSGMSMETYGMGWTLGEIATGKGDYARTFAANNTVVVNGYSQANGGWGDYGINQVQVVAMEPAARQSAVSSNMSFTCSSFLDNVGTGAEATEQRTMAIIRTSPTNGYYVDIFRSDSSLANEYHDYIYHNIGSGVTLTDTSGNPLSLTSQPNRFTNYTYTTSSHGTRLAPGWGAWTNTLASTSITNDVFAQFVAQPTGASSPVYMDVHLPGDTNREYATAKAPIGDADGPPPYDTALIPTLDVRKYGSAWDSPFVAVYEPHGGTTNSCSVQNVATLTQSNVVVGVMVQSLVGGRSVVQYMLSNTNATGTYSNAVIGLSFKGRFGVATDNGDGSTTIYLGSGSYLSFEGNSVTVTGGTNSAAEVQFVPGQQPVISANAPVTVISSNATLISPGSNVPVFTRITRQPDGSFLLQATGSNSVSYRLWGTTNLANGVWTVLSSGTVTNSPFVILDGGATSNSTRFYRFSVP